MKLRVNNDSLTEQRGHSSLSELAYDRIEDAIVSLQLKPGAMMKMHELQELVGLGRTPVHQAVRRLAAETLMEVRPRDGLRVSPIELARDRRLLRLRRDMDRFVVRLAAERIEGNHLAQIRQVMRDLEAGRNRMSASEFNRLDRHLDKIIIAAAAEPFLERTLRPLHTVFRRIGYVYLQELPSNDGLDATIDRHLHLLSAIIRRRGQDAMEASDRVVSLVHKMFDDLEAEVDPGVLDVGLRF